MIQSIRPSRVRSFPNDLFESLESRRVLSTVPAVMQMLSDSLAAAPTVLVANSGNEGRAGDQFAEQSFSSEAADVSVDPSEGIVTTQPADSSTVDTAPTQLVITFDQPVSSFDLGFSDIRLDQVNADGTTTPLFNGSYWPQEVANNDDGLDPTFTQLTMSLDSPLADGNYQIVLVGGSTVSSDVCNGLWDPFSDFVVSTFAVATAPTNGGVGGTLKDPVQVAYSSLQPRSNVQSNVDLGVLPTISPEQPQVLSQVPGQTSVALYQFSLSTGHHWLLGLQAQAQADESGFKTQLSLYRVNADGSLQAVLLGNTVTGFSDSQSDAMTYIGLDSGHYCLAVSGIFYSSPGGTQSGAFQLKVQATQADQPAQVTGFKLNWVNPGDTSPAGFTVQFSNQLDVNGFNVSMERTPPLEVVDSNGTVWPVLPFNYDSNTNSLTLVLGDRLPAGTYFLKIGGVNGLTDLAGWTPVAANLPTGTLASWSVETKSTAVADSDLGIVWPQGSSVLSRSTQLTEGKSISYRFDVILPGFYQIQAIVGAGSPELQVAAWNGHVYLDSTASQPINTYPIYLSVGSYTVQWIGSAQPSQFTWTLAPSKIDYESLLNNGVGQWGAVSIGFASPGVSLNAPEPTGTPGTVSSNVVSPPTITSPSPVTAATALSQPLLLTPLTYAPLGMPSAQSQSVAVVGPTVEAGLVSVADNSQGLLVGVRYAGIGASSSPGMVQTVVENGVTSGPVTNPSAKTPEGNASVVTRSPDSETEASSIRADQRVLASTDWILGVGQLIKNFLGMSSSERATEELTSSAPIGISPYWPSRKEPTERDQNATMELPLGLLVTVAIAYRSRDPIRRWWKKDRGAMISSRARLNSKRPKLYARPAPVSNQGPHFGLRREGMNAVQSADERRGLRIHN